METKVKVYDYDFIRRSIKDGDILACSGSGFYSFFIKIFTEENLSINGEIVKFTHVGTFKWIDNELFIIEADKRVRLSRFSEKYRKYKGRLFVQRPNIPNPKHFIGRQLRLVDKKYDWRSILHIALGKKWVLNASWYCSELINFARKWYYTDKKPAHIKPHDLILKQFNILFEIKEIKNG